jgi:hypothetical protein
MSVTVVTTLHKDGYNLYGSNNIATWSQYFPTDWNIVYYAEKHIPVLSPRVSVVDFNELCPEWDQYYSTVKDRSKDVTDVKRRNWYKKALRWSFKMFTLLHAIKNTDTRYLIWLDADVVATKPAPHLWVETCLAGKCLAGQLEFIKAGGHVETGVLIVDLQHPDIDKLYQWIKLGYVDGKILDEEKAWDGIWIAKLVQSGTIEWNNLAMVIQGNVARAFSNEKLNWLTHVVGKPKFRKTDISARSGRSPDQELI